MKAPFMWNIPLRDKMVVARTEKQHTQTTKMSFKLIPLPTKAETDAYPAIWFISQVWYISLYTIIYQGKQTCE